MWLLNSRTWEFEEFISHKQAPPYAILSHTWGKDEVSFRDLESKDLSKVKRKQGFDKINRCRQQAAADDLEWIWVDTCCIDKRSSAELSEAINSMFQWYKSAAVCYAYLCDVPDDIESSLAGCRWVTRGWTLQELIAPREVVFYSNDWQRLGARSTHSALLADITGINEPFLRGRSVYKASIAQRMSWAAKRKTSREEDKAYCLLGMFDVNMPLIYGEGLKAFRRLQEILVHEYPEDHSLFAWGKIVEKPSNCIEDKEQIWGSKPISHQLDQVDQKSFGLLADSPEDFKDSGQFVSAPNAVGFFQTSRVATVNLIGHNTANVHLPRIYSSLYYIIHLKRPAIPQLFKVRLFVLLCGLWDQSHTNFKYVTIPHCSNSTEASRTNEIMVNDTCTQHRYTIGRLVNRVSQYQFRPRMMPRVGNGDLVIRRFESVHLFHRVTKTDTTMNSLSSVYKIPSSRSGDLVEFHCECSDKLTCAILITRLGNLAHLHTDLSEDSVCGRLRFGIFPYYIIPQPGDYPGSQSGVLNEQVVLVSRNSKERFTPLSFPSKNNKRHRHLKGSEDMKCKHDMVVPRDEWRISITGIADIRASVERFYFDDEEGDDGDSDDDGSNKDKMHRFADVLDIVVTKNRDKDSGDGEDEDEQNTEEKRADKEAAGDEDTGEESTGDKGIDDLGTRGGAMGDGDKNDQNEPAAERERKTRENGQSPSSSCGGRKGSRPESPARRTGGSIAAHKDIALFSVL